MPSTKGPPEPPVLLLHNVDPAWAPSEAQEAIAAARRLSSAMTDAGHPTTLLPIKDSDISTPLSAYAPHECIVFNWCESVPGLPHSEAVVAETIQSLHFVYTGAGPDVLTLGENKPRVKEMLTREGIPTPKWRIYDSATPNAWNHFPAIVKPSREHCSAGITREAVVTTPDELLKRVAYILDTFNQPALVEDFIDGREFHVSLWGNGHIDMLPPAEMDFSAFNDVHDRLCTYDAKFVPESIHYTRIETLLPAPLDKRETAMLERVAKAAYTAIGCRDYGRLDIRLRDGIFYVLDVNANADISADASMACAAEVAGYSYGAMASRLVKIAAERHPIFKSS